MMMIMMNAESIYRVWSLSVVAATVAATIAATDSQTGCYTVPDVINIVVIGKKIAVMLGFGFDLLLKDRSGPCLFEQESPANAKGTRDSSACMKAHCKQM